MAEFYDRNPHLLNDDRGVDARGESHAGLLKTFGILDQYVILSREEHSALIEKIASLLAQLEPDSERMSGIQRPPQPLQP